MLKIVIAENSLDPKTWQEFESENLVEFLISYFKKWPSSARIYHNDVSSVSDVTPSNEKDVEELLKLEGNFYVIVYPEEVITIIAVIVAVLAVAAVILLKPKIPVVALRNQENSSSNNELSNRTNKERINARIPDIFGQVRSVPDLIALPYKTFVNNVELEHSYMCIGRGEFEINDVREDTTDLSEIEATSAEFYGPNTSPNSGDTPFLTIGSAIATPIKKINRLASINGQILSTDTKESLYDSFEFTYEKKIKSYNPSVDFTTIFSNGENVIIENAIVYEEITPGVFEPAYDFNGTYVIDTVSTNEILVVSINANISWQALIDTTSSYSLNANLSSENADFYGPFFINKSDNEEIWANFVAINGIYKDNGTKKEPIPIQILMRITPTNALGVEIGTAEDFTITLLWSGLGPLNVGGTLKANPTFNGYCNVRVRRTTPKWIVSGSQVQDEIKWRDLFSVSPLNKTNFGNVTTIQTLTTANSGALEIKERKLNCLVTRKIPSRISGETFSTILYPTKKFADIVSFICLDRFIGNRQLSEIDFDNIYNLESAIETYFGTVKACEFSYTFDSSNLSFEEIISSVANSVFCIAYRRGNKIKFSFEKENDTSTILFNHRNKIPGTETRSVNFGNDADNDGVEYQYIDPLDDSVISLYFPEDKSAVNPTTIESIGVRNYLQAYFNAKRIYNKLQYKNLNIEFEALQESNICVINDRILVSDGTRSGSLEGEITAQNLLELELSQNVDLQDELTYTIFLQYKDGTVESMPVTKTSIANKVLLDHAPLMPLATNYDLYAKTTFIITANNDTRKTAFILVEKTPNSQMTSNLKAINYDARYYQNDSDFINGVIVDA